MLRFVSSFLLCFLFSVQADAGLNPGSVVVKVHSGLCNSDEIDFRGSGLLFQQGGDLYLITSDHVILYGNGDYCHEIWNEEVGRMESELLAADWGVGLALLRVKGWKGGGVEKIPTLDQLSAASPREGERVVAAGFPYGSNALVVDRNGRILLKESKRHLLPNVGEVLEVVDGHGEYGMSGGALFSYDESYILGLLSHQYLSDALGQPGEVREFESGSRAQRHLLVIPNRVIYEWLKSYLDDPSHFAPAFVRDPKLQITRRSAVLTAGLQFELVSGGDPEHPIGGGDAVGIGGAEKGGEGERNSGGACVIKITLVPSETRAVWFANARQERPSIWHFNWPLNWIDQLKENLLAQNEVRVPFLLQKGERSAVGQKVSFRSLAEFFSLLRESNMTPVTLLHSQLRRTGRDEILEKLEQGGEKIFLKSSALLEKVPAEASLQARLLLRQVHLAGELLKGGNWILVERERIAEIKRVDRGWEYLYVTWFDETVALYQVILQIEEELSKVKM